MCEIALHDSVGVHITPHGASLMLQILRSPRYYGLVNVLLALAIAACCFLFIRWSNHVGGDYLDTAFTTASTKAIHGNIASKPQGAAHVRITMSLDMLFPVIYGFLLLRLLRGTAAPYAAASIIGLAVGFDLIENTVEIWLLKDLSLANDIAFSTKVALTWSKFASIGIALLIFFYYLRAFEEAT
jgi:hypothetical protein